MSYGYQEFVPELLGELQAARRAFNDISTSGWGPRATQEALTTIRHRVYESLQVARIIDLLDRFGDSPASRHHTGQQTGQSTTISRKLDALTGAWSSRRVGPTAPKAADSEGVVGMIARVYTQGLKTESAEKLGYIRKIPYLQKLLTVLRVYAQGNNAPAAELEPIVQKAANSLSALEQRLTFGNVGSVSVAVEEVDKTYNTQVDGVAFGYHIKDSTSGPEDPTPLLPPPGRSSDVDGALCGADGCAPVCAVLLAPTYPVYRCSSCGPAYAPPPSSHVRGMALLSDYGVHLLIPHLGAADIVVLISESNSRDATKELPRAFEARRHRAGCGTAWCSMRYVRNRALQEGLDGRRFDEIVFSNDLHSVGVQFLIRLLDTKDGGFDLACGLDLDAFGLYDVSDGSSAAL
ncbi:hypothetical protein DFH06DRAFT_1352728 [Mycena polygramma]|nr:hypothetical protein DFH06DRAFT_1352728 [Mycena polygramma]